MPELLIDRSEDRWELTLNRPESGNSLSPSLVGALHQALDVVETADARVVVIRGSGRHFCTGFDLSQITDLTDADLLYRFVAIEQLLARLWNAPYMTIAVAHGRTIGAGADLFVACGRRLALDGTRFAFPGAAFGLILGTRRLGRTMGMDAALHLIASGGTIDARHAAACDLATAWVTDAELSSALNAEFDAALRLDPVTLTSVRRSIRSDTAELDSDLATLVRSAARPGLRERILAYSATVHRSSPQSQ